MGKKPYSTRANSSPMWCCLTLICPVPMAYKQRGESKPRCRRRGSSCCQGWMGKPIAWPPSNMGRSSSSRRVPPCGKSCLSSGAARKWGDTRGPGLRESFWGWSGRSEEHTSELQSRGHLVCRLLLEKKKKKKKQNKNIKKNNTTKATH